MCLAVPGRILDVVGDDPISRSGRVSFAGVVRSVALGFVPEAEPGDFVLVHAGIAIARLDADAARRTLAEIARLGAAADEPASGPP